ncbi:hypothetical protein FRC02_003748 [Tulasnella sp. 418]|nr:hypothetical protein FRC02_003748 [Tulasnella sp. 418]
MWFTLLELQLYHLPGHRPRVLDSLSSPLTRTETHARLDISANERERSVGLSSLSDSPKQQQQAITPSDYSTQPGRSSQPRPTRRTTWKEAQQNGQPPQPKRFSSLLRDKAEKKRRELQQKVELERKPQQVKRKVKKN